MTPCIELFKKIFLILFFTFLFLYFFFREKIVNRNYVILYNALNQPHVEIVINFCECP